MKSPFFSKACKSAVALAAAFSAAMLVACSDDSSISQGGTAVLPPVDSIPFTPSIPGDSSILPPENVTPGIPNLPDTDDQNPSDAPITDEDRADDGAGAVSSLSFDISGTTALGPFVEGATVSISPVALTTMTPGAESASAKTKGKTGSYSAKGSLGSAIASIEVKGSVLNYTLDEEGGPVTMKALVDLRNKKTVNVNLLTRLEYDRVQNLVSSMGLSFTAAKVRAEKEVLAALGYKADSTLFENVDLFGASELSSVLLAVTTALMTDRSAVDANTLLDAIAADIGLDGKWDDEASKAILGDVAMFMDISYPRSALSDVNGGNDVNYFENEVSRFWASMYGLGSCSVANNKALKPNGNALSQYAMKSFVCVDSLWQEASEIYVNDYMATQLFGVCKESIYGDMKQNAEGEYFICKKDLWYVATEDDMLNMAVSEQNGKCSSANDGAVSQYQSSYFMCLSGIWTKLEHTPVDYSKGRAMNKKLGRGINFGNSWEAPSSDDGGWSNPIQDGDFAAVKAAGFNSVRIPVRWYSGVDSKLSGVQKDVDLAMQAGLAVIINYHHYDPMYDAAKQYPGGNYESEKQKFLDVWKRVATTFNKYDDDKLVFEIFNEPHDMKMEAVNDIMTSAYKVIRAAAPGKTIMFESNGYSKFAQIPNLELPADGNIIVSGHYYEPYTFTHQGHGYDCNPNAPSSISNIAKHFASYKESISTAFPDLKGGSVPVNLGEFGVANQGSCRAISEESRAQWTDAVIAQAEKYGWSWHYWGYVGVGGFEAAPGRNWSSQMLQVFKKYIK